MKRSRLLPAIGLLAAIWCAPALHAFAAPTAMEQLRVQAARGDAQAQNELGVRLTEGRGVERNDFDAVRWFQQAAEQGLLEAQYNLSVMYANGQGTRQDDAQTVKWSRLAAERGHAAAQYQLGLLFAVGAGVEQSYDRAYRWFSLAAQRLTGADAELAAEDRDLVAIEMTPGQIAVANAWVESWKPSTAAQILAAVER